MPTEDAYSPEYTVMLFFILNFINIFSIFVYFVIFSITESDDLEQRHPCRQTHTGYFDCSGKNLRYVPRFPPYTRSIDLSRNKIKAINDSFVDLDQLSFLNISDNEIERFHVSNGEQFRKLLTLDLSWNHLLEGSFNILEKSWPLLELRIQHNLYKTYPNTFLSSMVYLKTLHIDVFQGFMFGNEFPILEHLSEIKLYPRNSFKLQNDSFLALRNTSLMSLHMDAFNFVYGVEIDVFSPLRHLQELTFNIGGRCNIRNALGALYGLRNKQMEYLNLANNLLNIARPIGLTGQDMHNLKTMCIRRVDLRRCSIFRIPYSIANSRFADCLEEIRIGNNYFRGNDFIPVIAMMSYANIKVFDCSYPRKRLPNVDRWIAGGTCSSLLKSERELNFTLSFPESLTTINISGFGFYNFHPFANHIHVVGKGLTVVDADFTELCFCESGFHISYDTNITNLDLTNWFCNNMDPTFLQSMKTLETLIFRSAGLDEGLKRDRNGILLKGLYNLRAIDMGSNRLTHLHDNLFLDQTVSLKSLSLEKNLFTQIPNAIQITKELKILNIQNNKLSSLSKLDTRILDECSEAKIKLSGNPFVCSCENLHMIQWLEQNRNRILDIEHINCTNGDTFMNLSEKIRQFELKCLGTFWLEFSASLSIVLILVIIVSAICYRYRVYIEYMYLILTSTKPKYRSPSDKYNFDGFISYSSKDTDWVVQILYKKLSEEMKINICIHDKDFIPGRSIANEILRCIDQSRKVIFVVTRNFLESDWGNYELEMARIHAFRSGRSGLLLILKDELLIDEMPDLLKRMWWKIVCMKWPKDETSEERKLFWHNLKIAMNT